MVLAVRLEAAAGERVERLELSRCCLTWFWTPALRRLSRIISTNRAESSTGAGALPSRSSGPSATTRWGDRLSTVNGPATRTTFGSTYGRSKRISVSAWRAIAASISSRAHPLADVGVLGDRLEGHVRHPLVDEALADVTRGGADAAARR